MPRRNRCVLPEVPCHITQRGVDRCEVFSEDQDRITYLRLIQENLADAAVRVLGYCLMSNHVHLIAVPAREDSLSILARRVHGRYAQYYKQRTLRALGTPLAEPLLWLHAWPKALVVSLGLRGTQSGTSRHGRASGGIPVVECGRAPGRR